MQTDYLACFLAIIGLFGNYRTNPKLFEITNSKGHAVFGVK